MVSAHSFWDFFVVLFFLAHIPPPTVHTCTSKNGLCQYTWTHCELFSFQLKVERSVLSQLLPKLMQ